MAKRPAWMGRLLVMLGRHPFLRQRAIQSLAAKPDLFEEFMAIHGGDSSVPKILAVGARMGWEFLSA